MASENLKNASKNGVPFLIASVICGYATEWIPTFIPSGDFRDWAYRSIPFLSLCILFIIKVLYDVGSMSVGQIVFNYCCASPRKKTLRAIMDDTYASDTSKESARKEYDGILQVEISNSSIFFDYVKGWLPGRKEPPRFPTQDQQE